MYRLIVLKKNNMKKLLLLFILFFGTISYGQDAFVRTYKSYISIQDDIPSKSFETTVTVVFNYNGDKLIKFYFPNNKVEIYRQVSSLEQGETQSGYKYQYINVVSTLDGTSLGLQLFDDYDILRLIMDEGGVVEFYE